MDIITDNIDYHRRAAEVQEIIGKMPPWIIRRGIIIITLIIAALLAGAFFFKYPDSIAGTVQMNRAADGNILTTIQVPVYGSGACSAGQKVLISLLAYPENEYGLLEGTVTGDPELINDTLWQLHVQLAHGLVTGSHKNITVNEPMKGRAELVLTSKSFAERLMTRFEKTTDKQ